MSILEFTGRGHINIGRVQIPDAEELAREPMRSAHQDVAALIGQNDLWTSRPVRGVVEETPEAFEARMDELRSRRVRVPYGELRARVQSRTRPSVTEPRRAISIATLKGLLRRG